jgi:type I restriction enzyme S subunit
MTVNELRTLVDNLHEYIHIPGGIDRLKKMVLHLAVSGQLVPQDASEGTGEELYEKIQDEKTQIANQGRMKQQKILSEITDNEAPFTIPPNWKWVRLGDLYSTTTGLTYKKDQLDIVSASMIRVMRGGNIFEMEYRYKHDDVFISSEYVKDGLFLRKNQLITPAVTSIEHIGKIARIEDNLTDTVVGGFVLTLSPWCWDDNISKYALLYFNTSTHRERCRLITNKSGQAFYNLSREKLLQLPVSLPPLQEQERIVAKVDNIFALIDQLSEVYKSEQNERSKLVASSLAQLAKGEVGANDSLALTHISEIIRTKADAKVLRQTILHLAMSGQLVPQDPSEGTGEELYQQIQAEKAELTTQGKLKKQKTLPEISSEEILFQVPTSWKWVRLAESYDVRDGTHDTPKYTTTGYPLT